MDRRSFVNSLGRGLFAAGAATTLGWPVRAALAAEPPVTIWSEADGAIKRLTCMLGGEAGEAGERVLPVLARLFAALRPATMIELLCADRRLLTLATKACQTIDPGEQRPIRAWLAAGVESVWARDRFVAVQCPASGYRLLRSSPLDPGLDREVPRFVASVCDASAASNEAGTTVGPWEGGDLLADSRGVLIGGTTLRRARRRWGAAAGERLLDLARSELGRPAVLVPGERALPAEETWFDYHLDMLAAVLPGGEVLLGDPDAGDRLLAQTKIDWSRHEARSPADSRPLPDRREQRLRLNAIEEALLAARRPVVRIPLGLVPGRPWMLSYTNVLQEEIAGRRIVYLPAYGIAPLDEAAADLWRARDYEVRTIAAAELIPLQGSLRCLTNVVERGARF